MARNTAEEQSVIDQKKEQYGLWLGLPEKVRNPKTLVELSKQLDVNVRTLTRWASDPLVQHNKFNALKILTSQQDRYEIIQSVVAKAKKGSVSHAKLFFEWQGEVGPINRQQVREEPRKFEVKIVS